MKYFSKKSLLIGFFLSVNSSFAHAQYVSIPETFSMEIEQVFKSSIDQKEKKNTGTIDYHYPNWTKIEIDDTSVYSQGEKTYIYTKPLFEDEAGECRQEKGQQNIFKEIFLVLSGKSKEKVGKTSSIFKNVSQIPTEVPMKVRLELTLNPQYIAQFETKTVELTFNLKSPPKAGIVTLPELSELAAMKLLENDKTVIDIYMRGLNMASKIEASQMKIPPSCLTKNRHLSPGLSLVLDLMS